MSRKPQITVTEIVNIFKDQAKFQKHLGIEQILKNIDAMLLVAGDDAQETATHLLETIPVLDDAEITATALIRQEELNLQLANKSHDKACKESYLTLAKALIYTLQNDTDFDYDGFLENQKKISEHLKNKLTELSETIDVSATSKNHSDLIAPDQKE